VSSPFLLSPFEPSLAVRESDDARGGNGILRLVVWFVVVFRPSSCTFRAG